jgi:hypothetical protein
MTASRSIKVKLAAAAAALIAGGVVFAGVPRADAVTPDQVISAVKFAYEAYTKLAGGELTLEQATAQVTNAIGSARDDILAQLGQIAAADVQACATSSVINVADIGQMTPDNKQAFAFATTDCVTKAQSYVVSLESKSSVNQIGYALNTVGPIALLARSHVNFDTAALRATLIDASNSLVAVLAPHCIAAPLWADAEPGAPVEVLLMCTAFNGTVGTDSVYARIRRGDPLPSFDYSIATETAMRGTSHELTVQVLPALSS